MPFYSWACEKCEKGQTIFATMDKCKDAPECCGQMCERDYPAEHRGYVHKTVFPYVTTHLSGDGKPVEVRDAGHLRDLCKKYNKTPRDDKGYINEESYTNEKGRWALRDAGRGLPGRWE